MSAREGDEIARAGRPPSLASTRSDDLVSHVDIAEITDDTQSLSTSAVLLRCKRKILKPYLRLFAVMGLRCFGTEGPNVSKAVVVCSYLHLVQVITFTVVGYAVQFLACFRRYCGSCKTEEGAFTFVLPSGLHFVAYAYALYLLRFKETEKFENMMERTFLLSAQRAEGVRKAHLLRSLWTFICGSILWLVLSFASMLVLMLKLENPFQLFHTKEYKVAFEMVLILATLWQDMVQVTIITSYCLQAQLLIFSLHYLRAKLLQHTIEPLSWIREINECLNFLNYLNNGFSPSVCIFIFISVCWAVSGVICLGNGQPSDTFATATILVIVCLWSTAAIVPFILAACLTSACTALRHLGHEVRIRPFVYQDTPEQDLDTILLYTSTLKLKAKLFGVPVEGRYLFACVTLIGLSVMVVEMNQLV